MARQEAVRLQGNKDTTRCLGLLTVTRALIYIKSSCGDSRAGRSPISPLLTWVLPVRLLSGLTQALLAARQCPTRLPRGLRASE